VHRFALGFVLGLVVATAIAASLWPDAQAPSATEVASEQPPPSEEHVQRERVRRTPKRTPTSSAKPTATNGGEAAEAAGDSREPRALAHLRDLTRAGEWIKLRDAVNGFRREHPLGFLPRELVEAIWIDAETRGPGAYAHEAARTSLRSWREQALVDELEGIANGDPASAQFVELSDELAASLAERPHARLDIARVLVANGNARLRRAGLHIAATAKPPDLEILETAARNDADQDTRWAGMQHLVNRTYRGDTAAAAVAGPLSVELFETGESEHRMRSSVIRALPFGGERGLDIAQQLVINGGLDDRDTGDLTSGLVTAGRLPQLLAVATGDRELLLQVCDAVFTGDEPRLSDVLALWPYVPRVIDTPEEDWTDSVSYTLLEVGRPDLIAELIMNDSLTVATRVYALEDLSDDEGDPQQALKLAQTMLDDPASSTALRQGTVEAVTRVWWSDKDLRAPVLALLDRVAQEDGNEWVRHDAAQEAKHLRKRAAEEAEKAR
jgi:hypothetical protein